MVKSDRRWLPKPSVCVFVSGYHVYAEDLHLPRRLRRSRVPDVQLKRRPGEVKSCSLSLMESCLVSSVGLVTQLFQNNIVTN